ncbi:MAG: Gfo/Idh/MocA family oxidoreductase [Verrucomicrobia bacterium]|nr:Gfo/Idh/MocA family oxidoreductase [Verrucomicrobiota bacterium]
MKSWTRRDFLRTSILTTGGVALAGRGFAGAAPAASGSPNGDIRVAIAGFRGKGAHHIRMFRDIPGVRLAALCDVDSAVLDGQVRKFAAKDEKVAAYRDYRKLLEDKTIDAVVIATPNHWHSLMAVWACQAGKDVASRSWCRRACSRRVCGLFDENVNHVMDWCVHRKLPSACQCLQRTLPAANTRQPDWMMSLIAAQS